MLPSSLERKKLSRVSHRNYIVAVMSHDLRIAIGQARNEKKLSQEQLAQLICEPKANISAYESGKSVPSGKSIASMEKALGVKLPRPEKKKISNE
jgi:putative transcription factor